MKTIHYIVSMALAFTVISCSDDIDSERHQANTGDEVLFGAALPGVNTRTVYGEETTTGFPIYWVQNDKVKVASPQCDVQQAEYSVSVSSETQNYATSLTKTGDAGIQWGTSGTADFYSIYPSNGAEFHIQGNTVTATLQVNATQHASTSDKQDANGKSYIYAQPAEMGNVMMYAKTADVAKSSNAVDLRYKPFSTVIEFEITAPATSSASEQSDMIIRTVTLTAPENIAIAGNFTFNFPTSENGVPTISNTTGGSNAITLHFLTNYQYTTQLSTEKNRMKAKMCLMPISGVSSLDGWNVSINTSAGTFSKTLSNQTGELKPGMVHKVKLPQLSYTTQEWTYDTQEWITSLPDYQNIYLSEVSLPGAWYAGSATSDNYQATADFTTLWNAGVRAFAVECRSWTERTGLNISKNQPSRICLSGTGNEKDGAYTTKLFSPTATYISSIISNIASAIKPDEYGVLVLSYADGGSGGHRTLDYDYFISGIANEITLSGATNIYAGEITANTTINDVLGKLIIKVNVDKNITKSTYTDNMNALLSYNPFVQQIKSEGGSFSEPYISNMYWKSWNDNYKCYASSIQDDLIWCFSSANRTQLNSGTNSDIPHYSDRQAALTAMMEKSQAIYNASTHNVWFYFNAGGTEATSINSTSPSPTNFASTMNTWLLNQINAKVAAGSPSPLGIVMFNQCTNDTYHGTEIIKAIIEMNSRFYLKHTDDNSGSPGTPTEPEVQSAAPGYNSGMIDNNTDAFGWTRSNR